jgi:hypothetical protein
MTNSLIKPATEIVAGRRAFLQTTGAATLSATAVALIVGCESMAQGTMSNPSSDVATLNVALGLEHEAINAYQLGAESKLLQPAVLNVAVLFQDHHKQHRDALIATIRKMGGTPVGEKSKDDYIRALNAASLKNQTDVLKLAQRLEKGAANAYLGVARLAADETMHWTALSGALSDMLPQKALTFGA